VSVFLDLLRLGAALLVLVGHMGAVYRLDLPDIIGHSAKEGVAIFFVLSGFVIGFVATSKEPDWRSFARARALRMYSVVPLAIVVVIVCHAIGARVNPALYEVRPIGDTTLGGALVGRAPGWLPVLRYLTFTNEIWFDRSVIATGAPFWSLGFEAAYYVAFALCRYGRGAWRWVLPLAWLALCGPRIAAAFPLWLLGVAAWHLVRLSWRIGAATGGVVLLALAVAAIAWRKWAGVAAAPLFEWPAPGMLAASMAYYLQLGVLVAAIIVVFAACTPRERSIWPAWAERAIRYGAASSFTLYIAHLPIMVLTVAIFPGGIGSAAGAAMATGFSVLATFALAGLGERRKHFYARLSTVVQYRARLQNKQEIGAID
jgi:peptidoglycan/LPS O-acetylase OafA/YrhL